MTGKHEGTVSRAKGAIGKWALLLLVFIGSSVSAETESRNESDTPHDTTVGLDTVISPLGGNDDQTVRAAQKGLRNGPVVVICAEPAGSSACEPLRQELDSAPDDTPMLQFVKADLPPPASGNRGPPPSVPLSPRAGQSRVPDPSNWKAGLSSARGLSSGGIAFVTTWNATHDPWQAAATLIVALKWSEKMQEHFRTMNQWLMTNGWLSTDFINDPARNGRGLVKKLASSSTYAVLLQVAELVAHSLHYTVTGSPQALNGIVKVLSWPSAVEVTRGAAVSSATQTSLQTVIGILTERAIAADKDRVKSLLARHGVPAGVIGRVLARNESAEDQAIVTAALKSSGLTLEEGLPKTYLYERIAGIATLIQSSVMVALNIGNKQRQVVADHLNLHIGNHQILDQLTMGEASFLTAMAIGLIGAGIHYAVDPDFRKAVNGLPRKIVTSVRVLPMALARVSKAAPGSLKWGAKGSAAAIRQVTEGTPGALRRIAKATPGAIRRGAKAAPGAVSAAAKFVGNELKSTFVPPLQAAANVLCKPLAALGSRASARDDLPD